MFQFIEACSNGDNERVGILITQEDPSTNDNYAIQIASRFEHIDIVRLLLEDPRVDPSALDNLAMRWADENGHTNVVQLLTEHMYRLDGPKYNENILT